MTAAAPPPAETLKRGVKLVDLLMLGAGTAIGAAIFTVLGPAAKVGGAGILITTLLTKWSGVPTVEGRMRRKRPEYEAYVQRTSGFIPLPPKKA